MAWVYILKSAAGKHYIGSTEDLKSRLMHHQGGHTPSTKRLKATRLVFQQEFPTLREARTVERRLKQLKRRDYLEKIVKEGTIRMTLG
jgi:putative endonuclease